MALSLTSSAFVDGGEIPVKYTCQGDDVSPPVAWQGVPNGTLSLVLILDDPDAPDPDAPVRTWVHWVVFNLPPGNGSLPEDVESRGYPQGCKVGINDWGRADYGGPCPPIGRHRYFHKLYALDVVLGDLDAAKLSEVRSAMKGHILAEAQIVGTYQKK